MWYDSAMFNHQARWDRALPNDASSTPGTSISATCLINKGRIIPQSFAWQGQEIPVTRINFTWKDKLGRRALYFFSVATPHGTFQIAFSPESLSWRLIRLIGP